MSSAPKVLPASASQQANLAVAEAALWRGTQAAVDYVSALKRTLLTSIGDTYANAVTAAAAAETATLVTPLATWTAAQASAKNTYNVAVAAAESARSGSLAVLDVELLAQTQAVINYQNRKGAWVVLEYSGQPANLNTVTIGGTTFTFKTTAVAAHDVQIGASAYATYQALATKLYAVLPHRFRYISVIPVMTNNVTSTTSGVVYIDGEFGMPSSAGTIANAVFASSEYPS